MSSRMRKKAEARKSRSHKAQSIRKTGTLGALTVCSKCRRYHKGDCEAHRKMVSKLRFERYTNAGRIIKQALGKAQAKRGEVAETAAAAEPQAVEE